MRNLDYMNDLYNAQDVILLCKIIENRFQAMNNTYGFNPRKFNSASSISSCIEREMSRIILALPTKLEHVEIFEETVTGGFSSVNTRLAFDIQIWLPNLEYKDNLEKNPINKNFNYKVVYNLKVHKKKAQKKRVITKILKLDENNQYGNGMTKPFPTGCMKDDSDISWETFNILREKVNFEDEIGHLYVVDTIFDSKNATKKQFVYNEIYPPIIEKKKIIDPCERYVFQLLEQYKENDSHNPVAYRATRKAHATMLKKKFLPLYLEYLAFVIKRVGWKVTKIHAHLTFEQKRFKKDFILMNQKSRQESKNNIEKHFYKSMNNSIFGYDCRNNLDNCKFVPIFDEFKEITYIGRNWNFFDSRVSHFVATDFIKQDIEEKYNDKLMKLEKEDKFYNIKLSTLNADRLTDLEAAETFEKKEKGNKKKLKLIDYSERKNEVLKNQTFKSLIDFDEEYSSSIKSLAVEQSTKINSTTRYLNEKMLMFRKVSIKSFVYDLIDVFMFPNEEIQEIYAEFNIERCYIYKNLTDTDSTSISFVFICDLKCSIDERKTRDIIFKVMIKSKIFERLNLSDDFWDQFGVQSKILKKQVGLFEIESINKANVITIALNPKKYYERSDDHSDNKKQKGLKKSTHGMDLDSYSSRLADLNEFSKEFFKKPKKIQEKRFQIINANESS